MQLYKVYVDGIFVASYPALAAADAITKAKEAMERGFIVKREGNFTAELF